MCIRDRKYIGHHIYTTTSHYCCGFPFHSAIYPSVSYTHLDVYKRQDYTDDGTGKSAKIVTRTDGNEDAYIPNFHNMNNARCV